MRIYLIILFLLLHTLSVSSQNIFKGKLVSGLTGRPIKFGIIELNNELLASTDTLGNFTIKLDSATNQALIIWSYETGWLAVENLQFNSIDTTTILLTPTCEFSAAKDITDKKIKLFNYAGGLNPMLTKADSLFEKRYKIMYWGDGGCTNTIPKDCIETYNNAIFTYLDKKYGGKWRKEVSNYVYGL